jgi:Ca2+-transporting ATPase
VHVAVKGAPETILDLCGIAAAEREQLLSRVATLAQDGLRVLGVARGESTADVLPETPREFALRFLGFISLADPVRAAVPAAIAECKNAGIRVVMITGDHPGTARAIAAQIGLDIGAGIHTGAQLAAYSDDELRTVVRTTNVYARVAPEQKLRLVQALKANGEVVAMTGDGVNDAPALKAAHIGVAMGSRGTDVAREAASLVLLHDDFASLVSAVRLGRRIYDNIRNAMTYLLAVHIPLAGMGFLPLLFGWPLFLMPVHVVFLEFVIDPACSLIFEADPPAADVMRRPPRDPQARLFSKRSLLKSAMAGASALLVTIATYGIALSTLHESQARALAFMALVIANPLMILASRMRDDGLAGVVARPNSAFWWISSLALAALALSMYVPAVARVFRFEAPPTFAAGVVLGIAVLALAALARITGVGEGAKE